MYATFAIKEQQLVTDLNTNQNLSLQLSSTQLQLASEKSAFQMDLSASQQTIAENKKEIYDEFANGEISKDQKDNLLSEEDNDLKILTEKSNRELTAVQLKETAIERAIKSLDTLIDVIKQMLEAVQQAKADGTEQSIPNFNGDA